MNDHIAQKLRELRLARGFTLDQVGENVGVSKQTLYKYENGIVTNIPSDKIEALAAFYGVHPAEIMGWVLPSKPEKIKASRASYGEDRQTERDYLFDAYQNAPENIQNSIKVLLDPFVPKHLIHWFSRSKK
jgi:transcriptional regulator with XRE-family HTH domain